MNTFEDLVGLVPDVEVVAGDVIAHVDGVRQTVGRVTDRLMLNEVGERLVATARAKGAPRVSAEVAPEPVRPSRRGRRAAPVTEGAALTLGVADTQAAVDQVSG